MAKSPIISHEELKDITLPSFVLSLLAGLIIILFGVFETIGYYNNPTDPNVLKFGSGIFVFSIFIHFSVAVLTLLSSIMVRTEHHSLGGSILLLLVSVVGFVLGAGFFIGPILGIIGGILGLTEHEKLIKHQF